MPRVAKTEAPNPFDRATFERNFRDFLSVATITSKDEGRVRIGESLYRCQDYALEQIFDGLTKDIHWFVLYKARQEGITTIMLLLDIFWSAVFPGLQGGIVFDTEPNKEKFRLLITDIIEHLPASHELPVVKHNRNGIVFESIKGEPSSLDYLVAGTKSTGGGLGRSRAFNFVHCTEVSSFGNVEGFESLKASLSDVFPSRLYVLESTPRGFNLFHDEWEDAVEDTLAKRGVFIPWYLKDTYRYPKSSALFRRYGWAERSEMERETERYAEETLGYTISLEQWSWYRHNNDPRGSDEHDSASEDRHELFAQEYPGTPTQGFLSTGSPFIPGSYITPALKRAQTVNFQGYRYYLGNDVTSTRIEPVDFARMAQLKIYESPVDGGVYVVSADPAYGTSERSDNFAIQVLRCYADRIVQVAEYVARDVQAFQFAWIILHLCGWYGDCRYILELNGSGEAVFTEIRHQRQMVAEGRYLTADEEPDFESDDAHWTARGLRNVVSRMRQFLYRRPDSMAGAFAIHFKTTMQSKFGFMSQMADNLILGRLVINSAPCLKEIQSLRKEGISIQGEGTQKDDRAVALALGVRAYIDHERTQLINSGRTFEAEQEREKEPDGDLAGRFMAMMTQGAMRQVAQQRRLAKRAASQRGRWGW